jgi:hypothetical protein
MTAISAQTAPGLGVDWMRGMAVTGTVAVHQPDASQQWPALRARAISRASL